MKKKKKYVAVSALILCIGAYVITGNILEDNKVNDDIPLHDGDVLVNNDVETGDTYMQELRATLEMERNKIISLLDEEEKAKLLNYMEEEKTIETLIKNKGLPDSFVVISDGGVNVTVNTDELDQEAVTKITEIILRQTDKKAGEIVIQDVS
ncbi:MAG: SpoIIIAH-like family protein [Bacillota bacterium]|nr:SpoIIIAH-like family protein [Bacillota bacterium]